MVPEAALDIAVTKIPCWKLNMVIHFAVNNFNDWTTLVKLHCTFKRKSLHILYSFIMHMVILGQFKFDLKFLSQSMNKLSDLFHITQCCWGTLALHVYTCTNLAACNFLGQICSDWRNINIIKIPDQIWISLKHGPYLQWCALSWHSRETDNVTEVYCD
jgi:hypothetical protein